MKRIAISMVFVLAVTMLALVGCGIRPSTPTPDDPSQAFTSAAETIVAQLTDLALTMHPSTPVDGTPVPATPTEADNTPTVTPTHTEEPPGETPTDTITPTFTPEPSGADPRERLDDPDFVDRFESAANWPIYNDGKVSFSIQEGELLMRAYSPTGWDGWMVARPLLENFYIEMTGSFRACSGLDRYGMLVRASRPETGFVGYLVAISCDGRYSLREWNGSSFTALIDWTSSEYIKSGSNEVNRIGLWAQGSRLVVYANGYELGEVRDTRHSAGRFGVFLGSINTANLTVEVEEVAYWVLP